MWWGLVVMGWILQVNDAFQRACVDRLRESDVLWVHDYHLMLLPGKVSNQLGREEKVQGNRGGVWWVEYTFHQTL